ncbi:MAG: hypothetical protein ABIO02_02110 [Patescibacteria group bacterium]
MSEIIPPSSGTVPPVPAQPAYVAPEMTPQVPPTPPPPAKKRKSFKDILMMLLIFSPILLFLILSTAAVLIAYEKVTISNKNLQNGVANMVMSIPFFPKTPKYVLAKSIDAQAKVKRFVYDLSFAASSPTLTSFLGTSNLDFSAKGPVDYTDTKNPSMALDINSKDINVNYILKDEFHYIQINKLPAALDLLFATMGISPDIKKQFIGKWFFVDGKPLDTEARRELQKKQEKDPQQSLTDQYVDKLFSKLKEKQYQKMLVVTKEKVDTFSSYKVQFEPSNTLLDTLYQDIITERSKSKEVDVAVPPTDYKISDTVSNFKMYTWIDEKEYYVRKMLLTFDIVTDSGSVMPMYGAPTPPPLSNKKNTIPMTVALKLSDFGKQQKIEKPSDAVNIEKLFESISQEIATTAGSMGYTPSTMSQEFSRADNTNRRSAVTQILNGIGAFQADHKGVLPTSVAALPVSISTPINSTSMQSLCRDLVPNYLPAFPSDPALNVPSISSCTGSWGSTGFTITREAGDRITISAPLAEDGEVISVSR